jgi:hypothetical protein
MRGRASGGKNGYFKSRTSFFIPCGELFYLSPQDRATMITRTDMFFQVPMKKRCKSYNTDYIGCKDLKGQLVQLTVFSWDLLTN